MATGTDGTGRLKDSVEGLNLSLMALEARHELPEVKKFLKSRGFTEAEIAYSPNHEDLPDDEIPETAAEEGKSELDRSPRKNWVERLGGLPRYVVRMVKHLLAKGMAMGHAIAVAINHIKRMCATGDVNWPGRQKINPISKAEACAALARWEAMKAAA